MLASFACLLLSMRAPIALGDLLGRDPATIAERCGKPSSLGASGEAKDYHVPGFKVVRVRFEKGKAQTLQLALDKRNATWSETLVALGIDPKRVHAERNSSSFKGQSRTCVYITGHPFHNWWLNYTEIDEGTGSQMPTHCLTAMYVKNVKPILRAYELNREPSYVPAFQRQ